MSTERFWEIKRLGDGVDVTYIEESWVMLIKYNYFYHGFHINLLDIYAG